MLIISNDVNNLKSDQKSLTWRSNGAISNQTITAIFSNSIINGVGIAFANLIANSTIQVKTYTNTGDPTPVSDSGVVTIDSVYPPPQGFTSNNLASFAYGGGIRTNGVSTGPAIATFNGSNKPGSNSTNQWLRVTDTSGNHAYLPYWT